MTITDVYQLREDVDALATVVEFLVQRLPIELIGLQNHQSILNTVHPIVRRAADREAEKT